MTTPDTPPVAEPAPDQELARPFAERYRASLHDTRQQRNLLSFQQAWSRDRAAVFAGHDFEAMRATLKATKADVVDSLEQWVEAFSVAARANGAEVHRAVDAAAACAQVLAICRRHGARQVIKSKSMVSEEVELNHYLQVHGIQAVESDLGEWLVQLAGERPSHMVLPVIHKNRQQAAELVSAATGIAVSGDNVQQVVLTARDAIRTKFSTAGVGLTGANALIAEDGSVLLVTNEGNADLTITLPPVQIVLAGIEKVLPTLADAALQLRLLARSATAQRITAYSTFVRRPAAGHHLHIILVDNGRTALQADERYRDALGCIRCGACADACPPFQVVGGHVFGHIYTGAIGLVVTPAHHGLAADAGPQSLCISCNACQTVCPVDIPLPRQILDRRAEVAERLGLPAPLRLGLQLFARPRLFDRLSRLAALAVQPWSGGAPWLDPPQLFQQIPFVGAETSWRSVPAPVRRPYRDTVPPAPAAVPVAYTLRQLPSRVTGKTVALFAQCLTDRLWPEQARAVQQVLQALGCRVVFPAQQHCCGLPALDGGDEAAARSMARQTITALEQVEADYVVSGASSCVAAILHDYPHLLRAEPAWAERAGRLAARTVTFTQLLGELAGLPAGALDDGQATTVTYHDFCQGRNVLHQTEAPRHILRDLLGCQVVELPEAVCCGFGGSRSVIYPAVAAAIAERKLTAIASTGASIVVTDNPGCIAHLRAILRKRGSPLQVLHIAEVVAARLG
jgi:iron-sulfur cluster protein